MPVPGETALITAAALAASHGHALQIVLVIVVAALAAIIGDNIGYRDRPPRRPRAARAPRAASTRSASGCSQIGEPFFERHGAKAVFFGRWIAGLRMWASWLAGASTCAGARSSCGTRSAASAGRRRSALLAYFVGHAAGNAIAEFGLFGLAAVLVALAGGVLVLRTGATARRTRGRSGHGPSPLDASREPPEPLGAMRSHISASAPSSALGEAREELPAHHLEVRHRARR